MKRTLYCISILALALAGCTDKNNTTPENFVAQSTPFINQLFIFQETTEPGTDDTNNKISGESLLTGAIYLTDKGHVISNTINEQRDTVSYLWGKYTLTDSTLTYYLTDEYYYHGRWDARWDVADPDYSKGQTRKYHSEEITLRRQKGDSLSFFLLYTDPEKTIAAKRYIHEIPRGLSFWPYREKENEKFYTWLFKQIPVLAEL